MAFYKVIPKVLSPNKCQHLLQIARKQFISPTGSQLVDYTPLGYKTSYHRYLYLDLNLTDDLFATIKDHLPSFSGHQNKRYLGLNDHLRISMYQPGQQFGSHVDGVQYVGRAFSVMTVLVSLNDNFEGGETCLLNKMSDHAPNTYNQLVEPASEPVGPAGPTAMILSDEILQSRIAEHKKVALREFKRIQPNETMNSEILRYQPETGTALVFDNRIWHRGNPVLSDDILPGLKSRVSYLNIPNRNGF